MKLITHEIGTKNFDGKYYKVVRNYFLYPKAVSWFEETHKEFSKEEKKLAKLQHKQYLRNIK